MAEPLAPLEPLAPDAPLKKERAAPIPLKPEQKQDKGGLSAVSQLKYWLEGEK